MDFLEFQWLYDEPSFKSALQETLNSSGQLLKKHFSSKELARSVRARDLSRLPVDLVNHMQINPNFVGNNPTILKETPDYLVLHKPSSIHCHPLCYSDQDTLLNFLVKEEKWKALAINAESYDRGLIYRLDFETSGVMLLAKTEKFFHEMRTGFHQAVKFKIYWAIVQGNFNQEGSWTHYFKASGPKGSKQKLSDFPTGDAAEGTLTVQKLLHVNGKSLVLVGLGTGLRHQIRAQLSHLGFPILGDELYGGIKSDRLFLHAWRYEWKEIIEDNQADLFDRFFDLNTALKMSHDVLGRIKSR